mmetsp:Transcript_7451/g.23138  ORF Transcript_7451/g.23138 Transcript_7451/m.23138 type:complete len:256 (-) Transcript_7451:81-848(-)
MSKALDKASMSLWGARCGPCACRGAAGAAGCLVAASKASRAEASPEASMVAESSRVSSRSAALPPRPRCDGEGLRPSASKARSSEISLRALCPLWPLSSSWPSGAEISLAGPVGTARPPEWLCAAPRLADGDDGLPEAPSASSGEPCASAPERPAAGAKPTPARPRSEAVPSGRNSSLGSAARAASRQRPAPPWRSSKRASQRCSASRLPMALWALAKLANRQAELAWSPLSLFSCIRNACISTSFCSTKDPHLA